ncbi:MAG TPA: hypothetical protein VHE30_24600 [Polyangiaceae bacterium]|nr:hypothetical protein [Polyangiaceae bacterium]
MKSRHLLAWLVALSSVSSLALADDSLASRVRDRVQSRLVTPLAQQESTRFSRGRPAPRERRVRVTDVAALVDGKGRSFLRFAVDVRFGSGDWREGDIDGCMYPESGAIYVKRGSEYRPAEFLLGKDLPAVTGVCEPSGAKS